MIYSQAGFGNSVTTILEHRFMLPTKYRVANKSLSRNNLLCEEIVGE